jgi:hypothetical protein
MKKLTFLPIAALLLIIMGGAPSAFAAGINKNVEIDVMTHLCNPSVKNAADFRALTNGLSPLAGFANQVLNCPTTVLTKNAPVAGSVTNPQTTFDYSVTGEHSATNMLSASMFHPEQICETDLNVDVNHDGVISSSTCLDSSEYHFNTVNADNGKVTVQETAPPSGWHYGALLFTPVQVDGNNDPQSLLSVDDVKGLIQLDTTNDTDKIITLHVYDFANSDNPHGLVNGMPASVGPTGYTATSTLSSGMGMGGMGSGSTTASSTNSAALIAEIQTLETQLNALLAQLTKLLAQLQ